MSTTDPRTGLQILDEQTCWDLVASKTVGRIAVAAANRPDIFPMNYAMDGHDVIFQTLPGIKLASAVLGKAVAFEVDDLNEDSHTGWSVVIHGVASEIEGTDALLAAEEMGIKPWAESPKFRYLRVTADNISGRRVV